MRTKLSVYGPALPLLETVSPETIRLIRTKEGRTGSLAITRLNRHKQFIDRNRPRDERLLDHVTDQRLERRPVGLDPIWPRIATDEGLRDFVEVRGQPRHHVTERPKVAHPLKRDVLGPAERVVEARGNPRIALVELTADCDEVHDRE